jgi:hypothetical protein
VTVHRFALSHTAGSFSFKLVPEALEMSGLREREYGQEGLEVRTIDMEVRTLDQQFGDLARVDYIKIDIEGAEIDCLTGGTGILAAHRPIISVEYGWPSYSCYGLEARSLFDFARVHGYVLSDFFANMILTVDEWTMVCDRSYWDFFLVPEEKVEWWTSLFAIRPPQG